LAAATMYVAAHSGFGRGDLPAFGLWPVVLILPLLAVLRASDPFVLHRPRAARVIVALALGALSGVLFTIALAVGMGGWIGAFSFPVPYIWSGGAAMASAIGALVSPKPTAPSSVSPPKRVMTVVLSFAIVAVLPLLLAYASALVWDRAEPELHLLPEGYEGPVLIVFGDSLGAPVQYEGKARLYEIPRSGVLRTRFSPNEGWSRPDYEYVDATGRRTPIVPGAPCDDSLPGDPVQACLMGQLVVSGRRGLPYSAYVVGRRAHRRELYERGDSLIRAVIFRESP
jgi:hypothetical protein